MPPNAAWPEIPYPAWKDSCTTLHLFTQIVGKVRLQASPWLNHGWQVPLYVSARGLTTGPIHVGERVADMEFDFIAHQLVLRTGEGAVRLVPLSPRSVADFYRELTAVHEDLGLAVRIVGSPNEVPDPIPFARDEAHRSYDPDAVHRFWGALVQADRVLRRFRSGYLGKASPVHFFWGGFDLAVTRFSGRRAPPHPGGIPHLPDEVTREAYSHEVSSAGFWPGGNGIDYPAFYSYAYPTPEEFKDARVEPAGAFFHPDLGEFVLPYDAVRNASDPDAALMAFLQSTYDAAADLALWDRAALECDIGRPRIVRPV